MDVPRSLLDLGRRFGGEASCRAALAEMRWSAGFRCRHCGHDAAWVAAGEERVCRNCGWRTTPTAGTVLHRSHLPLTMWFAAAYLVTSGRGSNSLVLEQQLDLGNKKTPLLLLRRFRVAMGASLTRPLTGEVEADETLVGGVTSGAKGRTTTGTRKQMVLVIAERGSGRARMRAIPDARAVTLDPLVVSLVAPGSTVITDGHAGYSNLPSLGYAWDRRPHQAGGMQRDGPHATPLVDGPIAQLKTWLAATYRKPPADLGPYLDEFCFRREFDPDEAFRRLLTTEIAS